MQRRLLSVEGVVQVNTWGGTTKEFEVDVDLHRLDAYNVMLPQAISAIGNANINVGGRTISFGQQSVNVRGIGLTPQTASRHCRTGECACHGTGRTAGGGTRDGARDGGADRDRSASPARLCRSRSRRRAPSCHSDVLRSGGFDRHSLETRCRGMARSRWSLP